MNCTTKQTFSFYFYLYVCLPVFVCVCVSHYNVQLRRFIHFAVDIILDEGMMASSLVRYSDVGHPMKPPELVVEQNDVIYVNTMMLQKLNNKR